MKYAVGVWFLVLSLVVGVGLTLVAQDTPSAATDEGATVAPDTPDTDDAASDGVAPDASAGMDWQEATFVLLVVAIVMAGLIGFEWINRRKQSFP